MPNYRPVTPLIAVDTIIELLDQSGQPIVLIERKNPPYGWAIPGGFVDVGLNGSIEGPQCLVIQVVQEIPEQAQVKSCVF